MRGVLAIGAALALAATTCAADVRSSDYPTISKAVEACHAAGGGRVTVPAGLWRTGRILLLSDVELHLEEGARLEFSDNPKDYLPAVPTAQEGVECLNYSPLVYAYCATNIAITGKGVLAPKTGTWREWVPCPYPKGYFAALRKLYDWMSDGVPLAERDLTKLPESNMRPQLIMFNRCRNIRLEGYQVREAPFWTHHLFLCEDVVMRGVDDRAHLNNTDGVDIEGSRNVLIEDCTFDQGDDVIVLKAGRNRDGWRLGRPTENVEVRNCTINGGNGVLTVGSEMSGGVRNVYLHDCTVTRETKHVFYVKTNRRRGGFVENIRMKDVKAADALTAISVKTDVLYQWGEFPDREIRYTPIRGLSVENLSVGACETAIELLGDAHMPIDGVTVANLRCERCYGPFRKVENAVNVEIRDAFAAAGSEVASVLGAPMLPRERSHVRDALLKRVHAADRACDAAWLACDTPAKLRARQAEVRAKTAAALGGWPERTPLNAKTVGTVSLPGCRVERVLFESMPGFYVTANLFLPDAQEFSPPYAGLVQAQGHSFGGKDCDLYQRAALMAARAGLATLVYDPVDQGERIQRQRPAGRINVVDEHNDIGRRAVLLGWNTARFRIFDGLRAFDYLAARPDIDANRLAVWGQSGGGTLSSYLMALEDRVKAASPSCYLTSLRALAAVSSPQDAEQNVFGQLAFGLNHAGMCLLRAPLPVCPSINEGDGFPYNGAIETFEVVREVYRRLGAADKFTFVDASLEHGWTESGRVYGIRWIDKWLNGRPGPWAADPVDVRSVNLAFGLERHEYALFGKREVNVTPHGDVRELPGAKSAYDFMREEGERLERSRRPLSRKAFFAVTGMKDPSALAAVEKDLPTEERVGFSVARSILMRNDDFTQIPTIRLTPQARGTTSRPVLVVGDGKDRRWLTPEVESLLSGGRTVMVADLRGFAETGSSAFSFYRCPDADEDLSMLHYWLGENLAVLRAEDLVLAARKLSRACGNAKVEVVASGRAAIPAAHARFAAPDLIAGVRTKDAPIAWKALLADPQAPYRFANVVHGAYRLYDWTDLLDVRRQDGQDVPRPQILPAPRELAWDDGELRAAGLVFVNAENVPAYALESLKPLAAEKGKPLLFSRDASLGDQCYRLTVTPSKLVAAASSDAGFIYAAATLLQLAARDGQGWRIPCCRIDDGPAFGLRAVNWLLFVESRCWSQDAGDGVEGVYRRSVATLDRMARYKVNGAYVDGFGWNPERFPGYGKLMRRIARAARERGVKIGFGGYYAGYGAQYFDWDGPKFLNLGADGKPFACIGRSRGLPYAAMGTCVTDERLVAAKAANLRAFAQSVHPGFLYIHGMDLARPADLAKYWKDRCPACRAKWPNDALDAADGAAGAYANLYDRLFEGATGWADAGTGYDPAKDCTFCFVSPNYGIFDLDDSEWSRICGYYRVLARCLRNKSIRFTVREQFMREDGADTRYAELRRAVGADAKFLGCIFTGCDGYYSSNLYSNDVENVRLYAGATDLFYATGNAFQVPRQVAVGAAMWNPAAVPSLEAVCESLVGAEDGPVLAEAHRGYPVLPLTSKRLPGYYFSDAWYDSEGAFGLGWLSNNVSRVDVWQQYRALLVASLADTARAEVAFGRVARKDEQFRRNAETCREAQRIGRLALEWTDASLLAIEALGNPAKKPEALAKCAALASAAKELEADYAARLERMTDPNGGDVRAGLDHAQFLVYEAESICLTLEKGVWREHPHRPWW